MFKKSLKLSVCISALVVAGASVPVHAQSASTFQKTCDNIRYGVDKAGTPIVQAACLKADGKTRVESAAALRGFQNKEGRLTAGAGLSSFQKSCSDMKMEVRDGHVHLKANCKKSSGEPVPTSTILYDVSNNDGVLKHKVAGNDKVVM